MTSEFQVQLTAPEWDYLVQLVGTRPINEALGLYTKIGGQLQGQRPVGAVEAKPEPKKEDGNG